MFALRQLGKSTLWSAVLAAALVHQLGACPCGCLDGNLWWQQAQALCYGGAPAVVRLPTAPSRSRSVDHVCNDLRLPYVVEAAHRGAAESGPVGVAAAPLESTSTMAELQSALDWNFDAISDAPPPRSALQVRASLQVFLI